MGKNDCFSNAYRLLKFVSYFKNLVREQLMLGLCWQNYLFAWINHYGCFHDQVVHISLCVTEVFIDSSVVKYIFVGFYFMGIIFAVSSSLSKSLHSREYLV